MQYLTENGVQHRDLKASNCLIEYKSRYFHVKLADFGLSKSKDLLTSFSKNGLCGTVTHMAPELLLGNEFTEKCDVYSFGIVTWEVLFRAFPFEGLQQPQIIAQVGAGKRPSPIPEGSPPELVTLMEKCWTGEPFVRPDFMRIVSQLQRISKDQDSAEVSTASWVTSRLQQISTPKEKTKVSQDMFATPRCLLSLHLLADATERICESIRSRTTIGIEYRQH